MDDTTQPGGGRGYRLTGRFLEACDCYAICPCWIDEVPDEARCTGIFAWDIAAGEAHGHDVSGLRVVSVSYHEGKRRGSRQRVVLLFDEGADDSQRSALSEVFSGRSGGPLGELAGMLGELAAQRSAKIAISWDGQKAVLDIDGRVRVANEPKVGPSGRVTSLVDPELSEVFGSPALVGVSTDFRVDLPELEPKIKLRGRSANTGWFSYTG
ncbi:MAG: DUF1326 domain-containing protein [Mycobacteriales bacterium]